MANDRTINRSEVPLCAFIILLLTHCYSVFAILDRRVYIDEDLRKNYKIEDFLWSGSGDGENETELATTEEQTTWERTTTVFHTTTIISTSTVFYNSLSSVISDLGTATVAPNCTKGSNSCYITPTPTISLTPYTGSISPWPPPTDYPSFDDTIPDQRYWLVTVLKVNGTDAKFVPFELEDHLAKLYKIAFFRHQERHLGLRTAATNATNSPWIATLRSQYLQTTRKRRDQHHRDTVTVHIHNITSNDVLNILYSVRVSGLPVLATTAANDMKSVSDAEVVAELGYPVLTKAEPFLRSLPSPSADKDYLIVFVSSVCATALVSVLIFVIFLTLKKRSRPRTRTNENSASVVRPSKNRAMNEDGIDNPAFTSSENNATRNTAVPRSQTGHKKTKTDSARTADGTIKSRYYSRLPPPDRPTTPNSFLSMPSVRDFPTTPLPGPLTNLLSTSSPPSGQDDGATERVRTISKLSRHASLEGEDPGVVGPMVWHVHRHQMKKAGTVLPDDLNDCSSADSDVDVGQMRKRLNLLLDDALSLYGSRRSSNDYVDIDNKNVKFKSKIEYEKEEVVESSYLYNKREIENFERRSQSAMFRDKEQDVPAFHLRPRISGTFLGPRLESPEVRRARISSTVPSTPARLHSRPLSAGPFHRPVIHPEFILTDAELSPLDPAVPIISAIKEELEKIPEYRSESRASILKSKPTSSSSSSMSVHRVDSARQ